MSNVINPVRHAYIMDPKDVRSFAHRFAQGNTGKEPLGVGETITSFTISPTPAAISAGFMIDPAVTPELLDGGRVVAFRTKFDPAANTSPAFDAPGTEMGVEITAQLSTPGEAIQRTGFILAGQR